MSTPYYSDEWVTLYHGDCREVAEWMAADVLVTDPPYGVAWEARGLASSPRLRATSVQSIVGDETTEVRDAALRLWGVGRPAAVFGSWREARPADTRHRLIWHKAGRKPGITQSPWFPADEEIYIVGAGWVGKPEPTVITTTEWRDQEPKRIGHPTPKPVDLMERIVARCPPGTIADPFAGSGSTLVAAKRLGRKAIGVELDERYCEIAAKRLAQGVLDFGASA